MKQRHGPSMPRTLQWIVPTYDIDDQRGDGFNGILAEEARRCNGS